MSGYFFRNDLLSEFERMQRQMATLFDLPSSLRATRSAFPQVNIGATDESIEVVAFAPGMEAGDFEVSIDKGLLTVSGQRKAAVEASAEGRRLYAQERFHGSFRRTVELPDNADPDKVSATYVNGCLVISIGKREASKPRSITVQ